MSSNLLRVLRESLPGAPTLPETARAVGISFSYLQKFETGQYLPKGDKLMAIARHYRVSAKELKLRFHQVALDRLKVEMRDHREALAKLGVRETRNKRAWRQAG